MPNSSPILSICIPTYNRFEYLQKTLESIISQEEFQDTYEVEIVISDNASNDNTQELCVELVSEYPSKIVYNRNDVNIHDENFEKVLSIASGEYLKLNNDTFLHKRGSLKFMLNVIKTTEISRTLLIFNFGNKSGNVLLNSADEFINYIGKQITWISIFGLTKKQFNLKKEQFNNNTKLGQVNILLEAAGNSYCIRVITCEEYFESHSPSKKGGYDLITVFIDNYLHILRFYLKKRIIKKETYINQKLSIIFDLVLPFIWSQKIDDKGYNYDFKFRFIRITVVLIPNLIMVMRYWKFEVKLRSLLIKKLIKSSSNLATKP